MVALHNIAMMKYALRLAQRHRGNCGENPSVGCVITQGNTVVGLGTTAIGGRPHAEPIALDMAADKAQGATLYVTLEPCAHHGQTPPCIDAIIHANIARVYIAAQDPDPRVAGKGIAALKQAGIEVFTGLCEAEALAQHAGFFHRIAHSQPRVTMKLATTIDGKIANAHGQSQWITGELARNYGHALRASHDAILTGIGTAKADNPNFTCRLAGLEQRSPIRIILDVKAELSVDSALAQTAHNTPTWIITDAQNDTTHLEKNGVQIIKLPSHNGHIHLEKMLNALGEKGINTLMVEAGASLSTAFLKANITHELYWFTNPSIIGNAGLAAIGELAVIAPDALQRFSHQSTISLGADQCTHYRVA